MMKVVIGIPTFNQQQFIKKAVDSCLQQTFQPLQIIIGDDQSDDGTDTLFIDPDANVKYIKSERRLGRLGNYRQLLYNESEGAEWYLNLDGDDFLSDPDFISYAIELIQASKDPAIVFFQGNHNIENIKKLVPHQVLSNDAILINGKDYFLAFPKIMHFIHCATMYKREKALPLKFYSYNCLFSDFHSLSRLSLVGNIILSSRKVAVWRQHDNNATNNLTQETLQNELDSVTDIGQFAFSFLLPEEVNSWVAQMHNYYRKIFIYKWSSINPGWQTIAFILKHFRLEIFYFKFLAKNLLTSKHFSRNKPNEY